MWWQVLTNKVYDLLDPDLCARVSLHIREIDGGTTVAGVIEAEVRTEEEMATHLSCGSHSRATGSTDMNDQSRWKFHSDIYFWKVLPMKISSFVVLNEHFIIWTVAILHYVESYIIYNVELHVNFLYRFPVAHMLSLQLLWSKRILHTMKTLVMTSYVQNCF